MARCAGGFHIGEPMNDRFQHFAAHPYYLLGVTAERERILQQLKDREDWHNVQDVIDALESGK